MELTVVWGQDDENRVLQARFTANPTQFIADLRERRGVRLTVLSPSLSLCLSICISSCLAVSRSPCSFVSLFGSK
jgi:hypothetical protein